MEYTLNQRIIHAKEGETYLAAAREYFPELCPMGVRVGGESLELTERAQEGAQALLLTYERTEGRLIYERSLRFVFLLAVKQLFPERRVRLEHSLGNGVYAVINGPEALTPQAVRRIEERMKEIVRADLPFIRHEVTREQAMAHFEATGQTDKVELLKYRPYETFHLYSLDGML